MPWDSGRMWDPTSRIIIIINGILDYRRELGKKNNIMYIVFVRVSAIEMQYIKFYFDFRSGVEWSGGGGVIQSFT